MGAEISATEVTANSNLQVNPDEDKEKAID